jgi:glucose/arabinose dehydrogenase
MASRRSFPTHLAGALGSIVILGLACTRFAVVSGGLPLDAGLAADGPVGVAQGDPCRGTALPVDDAGVPVSHFVASGLCARLVASNVSGLRQLTFAPNGDLLGTSAGTIWLFRDENGDGVYQKNEIHSWADTGGNGNNAHLDLATGFVYAGTMTGVRRYAYAAGALTGGPPEDVVVGEPTGGHPYHTTHVYDHWLYVHSGSNGNVAHESGPTAVDYDTKRSLIKRFDLAKLVPGTPFQWDDGEAFTVGLRNANGFTRNELTGKMYAVVNGLDGVTYKGADVHIDNPGEQVIELAAGKKYGYPFCLTAQRVFTNGATGQLIAPGTQLSNAEWIWTSHDDGWCAANSLPPTTFVQAHSAPLDIVFFDRQPKGSLPERWRGGAFIAFHGSWNRESNQTGYKVVWMPFNADGTAPMPTSDSASTTFPYEIVFGGGASNQPKDGPWGWSNDAENVAEPNVRPAGVAISPVDGALYVASDASGMLYRIGGASAGPGALGVPSAR